jgi:hypothetical protein
MMRIAKATSTPTMMIAARLLISSNMASIVAADNRQERRISI